MFAFLAAVAVSAAPASVPVDVQNLPRLFQATCLDGQATLSANEVTPISFEQLPSDLRESLGKPGSGKIWQLNTSGHSYLYLFDNQASPGVSPKICGLASDAMDLRSASDLLEARVTGKVERNKPRSAQWMNATDGYVATATTAAKFNVLQISWMSEADKRTAEAQAEQLAR